MSVVEILSFILDPASSESMAKVVVPIFEHEGKIMDLCQTTIDQEIKRTSMSHRSAVTITALPVQHSLRYLSLPSDLFVAISINRYAMLCDAPTNSQGKYTFPNQ
jgi:hypothetical protein